MTDCKYRTLFHYLTDKRQPNTLVRFYKTF